jgi:uncharacterized phage-like protein YoqJ
MRTDVKNKNIQNFIKNNTGQIIYLYDSSKKTQKSLASVMNLTKSNSNLVLKCIV